MASDQDARQAILDATRTLVSEAADLDAITVRQIAQRAGVGAGLVNYHFASKDNLLGIVIGSAMTAAVRAATEHSGDEDAVLDPATRLKDLLKELCALGAGGEQLTRFMLRREVVDGSQEAAMHLVPLLRDLYPGVQDEARLRILAVQILHPIQVAGLNPDAFHRYSGFDLIRPDQRDRFVDVLVDNLVPPPGLVPRPERRS